MRFKRILSLLASAAMLVSALCGAMTITAAAADAITTGRARGVGIRHRLCVPQDGDPRPLPGRAGRCGEVHRRVL